MHGQMFREFLVFAEDATSSGFVDDMICAVQPAGRQIYDAPGPHDVNDLIAMMDFLARRTGYEPSELCYDFGWRLFQRFTVHHPDLFIDQTNALDFLQGIEAHIHDQVRALVPKSNPPRFEVTRSRANELVMHYQSDRPFADLCAGLIDAALDHFKAAGQVRRRAVGDGKTEAVFTIVTDAMSG